MSRRSRTIDGEITSVPLIRPRCGRDITTRVARATRVVSFRNLLRYQYDCRAVPKTHPFLVPCAWPPRPSLAPDARSLAYPRIRGDAPANPGFAGACKISLAHQSLPNAPRARARTIPEGARGMAGDGV